MPDADKQLARSTGLARRMGLAKRSRGGLARVKEIVPFEGDVDPDVIDAVFEEVRKRGRGPGGASGPFYAGAPTRRALPAAGGAASAAGGLATVVGKAGKVAKGVGRFLGPAAVGIAAADILMRVLDSSQGRMDRERLHHGEVGNDVLGNLGVGLQELEASNQGRAIQSIGNVGQGLDIAGAMRQPAQEANDLENILTRRKAEIAGVGVRAQPGEDEYLLAMRRFM